MEFNLLRLDLAERQQQWKLQMRAILARGQMEWTDGEKKLKTNYETWLGDTRDSYDTKSGSWNDKYLDFLKDKETWVRTVTAQSAMIGDQDVLENFGQSTQAAIDAAGADVIVTDMESAKDPDELLGEALDLTLLSKLLENADSLNRSISMFKPAIFTALDPDQYTSADLLQKIKDGQTADDEELRKRTLILQYERMLDQARAAEKQITDQVTEANAGVDRSLNGTLADAGYERSGAAYVKDAVVGSAVTGLITKRVSVKTYDYFTNLDLKIAEETSVNEDALLTLGSDALDQLLDKVMNKIETRTKAIFGDDEDLSTFMIPEGLTHNEKGVDYYAGESIDGKFQGEQTDKTKIEQKFTQQIEWIETVYEEVATQARTGGRRGPDGEGAEEEPARIPTYVKHTLTRGVDLSPGEFGAHVGYAPGFSDKVDVDADKAWDAEGNIQFQGLGQMGTIMGQFIYNSMLEGKGWGEANLPGYSKRLWDDSGDLIKAPTMRGVIDMGITVATMAIPGGQLISAVMNLADDALFTALDVGNSQMSWQEGLLSFGKQVAVKALTPGGLPGGGTLLEKAVSVVGSGFANNMIGGMINSFEFNYDDDGNISGFGMNGDVIRDSLVGKGALAGYASAFASSLVSGGVAGGMKGLEGGFYEAAANIAGDVAGQAAKYGVYLGSSILENGWGDLGSQAVNAFDDMGGITINIANLGALLDAGQILGFTQDGWDGEKTAEMNGAIDRLSGAGLFELNFSSKGMTGRLGMGGMNLGGNLYKLGKGVVADTMLRNQYGGRDSGEGFALAANYALGDDLGEDMMWRVLLGKDTVSYDRSNADGNKLEAETTRTDEGNRVFHFDSSLAGASGDDAMLLATAFQHESWRNGLDDGAAGQRTETIGAAFAHTEMALALSRTFGGDSFISNSANLSDDVNAYFKAKGDKDRFGAYVDEHYDSSADYWKLVETESGYGFEWDGEHTFDLSILGVEGRQDSISAASIDSMWTSISGNTQNSFATKEEFNKAIKAFNTLSAKSLALEKLFVTTKDQPSQAALGKALTELRTAMSHAESSSLLARNDATIDNGRLAPEKAGKRLFRGDAIMTSDFGAQVRTWRKEAPTTRWHGAWDMIPEDYTSANRKDILISDGGSLGLGNSGAEGLILDFQDSAQQNKLTFSHASSASIKQFMGLFASTGVSFDGDRLQGLVRNMVIGTMGTTGTESTGDHVHLAYYKMNRGEWESANPKDYFGTSIISSMAYGVVSTSGMQQGGNPTNYQLNTDDLFNIYTYSKTWRDAGVREKYSLDYNVFTKLEANNAHFGGVNWVELERRKRRFDLIEVAK